GVNVRIHGPLTPGIRRIDSNGDLVSYGPSMPTVGSWRAPAEGLNGAVPITEAVRRRLRQALTAMLDERDDPYIIGTIRAVLEYLPERSPGTSDLAPGQ